MKIVLSAVLLCLGASSVLGGNHGYGHQLTPQELIAIDASLALHGHSEVGSLSLKSGHGLADHLNLAAASGHGLHLGQVSYGHGHGHGGGGGIALANLGHGGGYALNLGQVLTKQVVHAAPVGGPVLTKHIIGAPVLTKQIVGAPVLSKQVVGSPVVSGIAAGKSHAVLGAQIVATPVTYASPLKVSGPVLNFGVPTYKSVRTGVPLSIQAVHAAPLQLSYGGLGLIHGGLGLHTGLGLGLHGW